MLRILLNATNFRSPLLRTVVPTVAAAFAIQGAVAIPSILAQTERFYDLSGSLTYLSCTALSLYLPVLRARALSGDVGAKLLQWPSIWKSIQGKSLAQGAFWDWRQLVLTAAVSIWATRCMLHEALPIVPTCLLTCVSGIVPLLTYHEREWRGLTL
jgi:hypothetical protein